MFTADFDVKENEIFGRQHVDYSKMVTVKLRLLYLKDPYPLASGIPIANNLQNIQITYL